jgi:hypothetical protein
MSFGQVGNLYFNARMWRYYESIGIKHGKKNIMQIMLIAQNFSNLSNYIINMSFTKLVMHRQH